MTHPGANALPAVVALALCACATAPPPAVVAPVASTAAASKPTAPARGELTRIPLETLFELQLADRAVIYDVRPAFFHQLGHIPGSTNWPKSAFDSQLPAREAQIRSAIAAGKAVVLYCTDSACPDAHHVASRLAARGHSVAILEGGWDLWKKSGLPTH
jgi:rhodanese-related sulfurtransferase